MAIKGGTTFVVISGIPPPNAGTHNRSLSFKDITGVACGKIVSISFFGTLLNVLRIIEDGSNESFSTLIFFDSK
jgi:hypothetical protein